MKKLLLVTLLLLGCSKRHHEEYMCKEYKWETNIRCTTDLAPGMFVGLLIAGPLGGVIGGAAGSAMKECKEVEEHICYHWEKVCRDKRLNDRVVDMKLCDEESKHWWNRKKGVYDRN